MHFQVPGQFQKTGILCQRLKGCDRRSFRQGIVRPPIRLGAVDQCEGLRCVRFALTREFFKTEDNVLECLQICDFIERRGLKFLQQRLKSARVQ